jgi:hypothetical protein
MEWAASTAICSPSRATTREPCGLTTAGRPHCLGNMPAGSSRWVGVRSRHCRWLGSTSALGQEQTSWQRGTHFRSAFKSGRQQSTDETSHAQLRSGKFDVVSACPYRRNYLGDRLCRDGRAELLGLDVAGGQNAASSLRYTTGICPKIARSSLSRATQSFASTQRPQKPARMCILTL